jgi:hypothetical protein
VASCTSRSARSPDAETLGEPVDHESRRLRVGISQYQSADTITAITVVPCDTAIGSMNVREVIGIQVIGPDELLKLLDLSHQPIH